MVREGIARALAVPEASAHWSVLARLYRDEPDVRVKDGLAVALAGAVDDSLIHDLLALARDATQGPSRVLLLAALERAPNHRALMALSTDANLAPEIQAIQRRVKRRKR